MSTVFKQIHFDELTGRLSILDGMNNNYECNVYGSKKASFAPNVTGFASFKQRKMENINLKYDEKFYHPQTNKFEGYGQFPRPLSQPFFNLNVPDKDKKRLSNLINEGRFLNSKNKHQLTLLSNQGLHYFTSSFSMADQTSTKKFISAIEKHLTQTFDENKYKLDLIKNDPKVKALKRLRSLLLNNCGDKLILGRRLPEPKEKFKDHYINNSKLMRGEIKLESNSHHLKKFKNNSNVIEFSDDGYVETKDNFPKIKDRSFYENKKDSEKKLLKGFQPKPFKEKGFIIKDAPRHLKSAGQLYNENINLLKAVNPIAFQKEDRKNQLLDDVLKKKIQTKKIFEKNLGF